MFSIYLKLGIDHIADIKAYDHLLFIITLCVGFPLSRWRQILILVTAFTIGHSLTLALSALHIISLPSAVIEVLIPVTILITALRNILYRSSQPDMTWKSGYWLPLGFGLIHGMGFSSYFKSLLGREADILLPLFAFNVGVEIGQLIIVLAFCLISLIISLVYKSYLKWWTLLISGTAVVLSVLMIINRLWQP